MANYTGKNFENRATGKIILFVILTKCLNILRKGGRVSLPPVFLIGRIQLWKGIKPNLTPFCLS